MFVLQHFCSLEKFFIPCSVLDFVSRLMMTFDPRKVCFDHIELFPHHDDVTNYTAGPFLQYRCLVDLA